MIDSISPLEPDRKCFRMVGGVLVERTVKEVLPALQTNYNGVCVFSLLLLANVILMSYHRSNKSSNHYCNPTSARNKNSKNFKRSTISKWSPNSQSCLIKQIPYANTMETMYRTKDFISRHPKQLDQGRSNTKKNSS